MIDDVPLIAPPLVATTTAPMPSAEAPPPGETTMPPPTAEQVQAADRIFSAAAQPHALVTLLGVATSIALLRDVAVDPFDTPGADDEANEKSADDEDADSID